MQSLSAFARVGAIVGIVGGVFVLVGYLLPLGFVYDGSPRPVGDADPLLALAALVVICASAASALRSKWSPLLGGLCVAGAMVGFLAHLCWSELFSQVAGWGFDTSYPTRLAIGFWVQLAGCFLMLCGSVAHSCFSAADPPRPDPL